MRRDGRDAAGKYVGGGGDTQGEEETEGVENRHSQVCMEGHDRGLPEGDLVVLRDWQQLA